MKFNINSTCRKCGREFSTMKRYNDFIGQWELDNDSCEECAHVGDVLPVGNTD